MRGSVCVAHLPGQGQQPERNGATCVRSASGPMKYVVRPASGPRPVLVRLRFFLCWTTTTPASPRTRDARTRWSTIREGGPAKTWR
eukprot:gene18502-biopygen8406